MNKKNKRIPKVEKKQVSLKRYLFYMILCYLVFVIVDFSLHTISASEVTKGISEKIIRLHVLANSDNEKDQELKLKVKDQIVKQYGSTFAKAKSKIEARKIIEENYSNIRKTALEVIRKEGYNYDVKVYLTNCMFPTKVYDDMTFPAGEYEALKIEIGKSNGQNWWCIMYPPLCFVDKTYTIVPEDSKVELQELLTEKEYQSLFSKQSTKIVFRFKLPKILKDIFR